MISTEMSIAESTDVTLLSRRVTLESPISLVFATDTAHARSAAAGDSAPNRAKSCHATALSTGLWAGSGINRSTVQPMNGPKSPLESISPHTLRAVRQGPPNATPPVARTTPLSTPTSIETGTKPKSCGGSNLSQADSSATVPLALSISRTTWVMLCPDAVFPPTRGAMSRS